MFDPNEALDVPLPVPSDIDGVEVEEELVPDRVVVSGEVTDFSRLNFDTPIPSQGVYGFTCAVPDLLEATRVTALTTTASYNKIPTTRVTVYSDGVVRIATYNIFTFSEVSIPTVGRRVSFSEPVESVAFVINHTQLLNIAKAFIGELQFKYLAESHMLEVQNEDTCLGLTAYSEEGFIDNLQQIKSIVPTYSCPVNTEELKRAFDFVSPFAKRNEASPRFSVLEVRNSSVMSGTKTVTGVYASAELPEVLRFRVRYEAIPVVSKLLTRFNPGSTYLFDFEKYFVIRDVNYILGFEKVLEDFPDMGHLLDKRMPESIIVPRVHLQGHLARVLAVLSKNVDVSPSVTIEVKGSGAEAMMYLKTTETSGRESVTKLPCFRQSDDPSKVSFNDVSFKVSSTHLVRVIHCFDSSNCCFALDDRGVALFIIDPVSEGVCATSVLALVVAVV